MPNTPAILQREQTHYRWHEVPTQLKLGEAEVHVWFHSLEASPWAQKTLPEVAEEQRAQRFLLPHLQEQFRAAHGFKRALLARYCQQTPAQLQFFSERYGKPILVTPSTFKYDLHFNLSHTQTWCAIAIARHRIGLDLENNNNSSDWRSILPQCLHHDEQAPDADHFFQVWCAKEAVSKFDGRGLGLSFPHLYLKPVGTASQHWAAQYQTQNQQQQPLDACQVALIPHPIGLTTALAWGSGTIQVISYLP